jgi:hypothetical protein
MRYQSDDRVRTATDEGIHRSLMHAYPVLQLLDQHWIVRTVKDQAVVVPEVDGMDRRTRIRGCGLHATQMAVADAEQGRRVCGEGADGHVSASWLDWGAPVGAVRHNVTLFSQFSQHE